MISCDIQLLIGLILYFSNGWFDRLKDLGNNMKDPVTRFFTMEHMSMMILAWILVHVGRASVKKAGTDAAKHKKMLIFFGSGYFIDTGFYSMAFQGSNSKTMISAGSVKTKNYFNQLR